MDRVTDSVLIVPLTVVKATIAAGFLESRSSSFNAGQVSLKPHQISATSLLRQSIEEFGGAVLCDPVGTGKTFTALAVAPAGGLTLVIAPAVLRSMWTRAASQACRKVEFVSFESLSRSNGPKHSSFDFAIVDEAHHVRNPATTRYRVLCQLISGTRTVMLTATPIHNRRRDLQTLLRVFLGARAEVLSDAELGRCVISRDQMADGLNIPHVEGTIRHRLGEDETIPALLLALPPPVPPSDGGDGGALVIHSLIRQWASSNAALDGALRRRMIQSSALIAALEDGAWPTRGELSSWLGHDGAIQLGFTSMLASANDRSSALLPTVVAHRDAVRSILDSLRASNRSDDERVALIRNIRSEHPVEHIVAFSAYADTVNAIFARLVADGRVAALSANGATVAGGRISRCDAISRFAPKASGVSPPARAEEITLLLTTDLLSEGVNLQDASVVIHLDLPWTPARVQQRVGRLARIGSAHSRVVSHAIHPPVSADFLVHIELILRQKLETTNATARTTQSFETIRSVLKSWMLDTAPIGGITVAAVSADVTGFIALCFRSGAPLLVTSVDGNITDRPDIVLETLGKCEGNGTNPAIEEVEQQITTLSDWLSATAALDDISNRFQPGSIRDLVARRISSVVASARPHESAEVSALASAARAALHDRTSEFVERRMERHLQIEPADARWLKSLLGILGSHGARWKSDACEIRAMILLQRRMR